jgi:hypothetical protein
LNRNLLFHSEPKLCASQQAHGTLCECEQSGMLRARFAPEGLLEELEMTFDGIAFYHQLMRAKGQDSFALIPNTLDAVSTLQQVRPELLELSLSNLKLKLKFS